MKAALRKIVFLIIKMSLLSIILIFVVDLYIRNYGSKYIVNLEGSPQVEAIIVPGAYVFPSGRVSDILADRLSVAVDLYKANKAEKLLVSGDHGSVSYDEVNAMRRYLQSQGIPRENIFMDHAGFSTYDSLYRTRDIFGVKKAIIVTQEYHLARALYTARKLGIEAYGVTSDKHIYYKMAYYEIREIAARCKAFLQVDILRSKPKYLGEAIPISGDGRTTDDGK